MRMTVLSHVVVVRIKQLMHMKGVELSLACGVSHYYYYAFISTTL